MQAARELVGDDEVSVVINGDITNGIKYPENLVDDNIYNQARIAASALEPWTEFPTFKSMRFIHGTATHEMTGCATSALVAEAMRVFAPGSDIKVARHALFDVGVDTIDAAHHGPSPGIRNWTQGNQLRYYLRSLMLDEIVCGRTPPRVVMRAHFHTYTREQVEIRGNNNSDVIVSDIFILPSYCGLGHHAVQVTRSSYIASCGLVVLEFEDGKYVAAHPFWRKEDLRTKESL
jgi:hypothetical protein